MGYVHHSIPASFLPTKNGRQHKVADHLPIVI